MRISDWSSDVCSSDLAVLHDDEVLAGAGDAHGLARERRLDARQNLAVAADLIDAQAVQALAHRLGRRIAPAPLGAGDGVADEAIVEVDEHARSEEHTSELQSLMRNSYAVFCLKKKNKKKKTQQSHR